MRCSVHDLCCCGMGSRVGKPCSHPQRTTTSASAQGPVCCNPHPSIPAQQVTPWRHSPLLPTRVHLLALSVTEPQQEAITHARRPTHTTLMLPPPSFRKTAVITSQITTTNSIPSAAAGRHDTTEHLDLPTPCHANPSANSSTLTPSTPPKRGVSKHRPRKSGWAAIAPQ